ncbi:MAG: [protein-PII] uridylyltransferase [Thermodesulfobacteriota bacterium]
MPIISTAGKSKDTRINIEKFFNKSFEDIKQKHRRKSKKNKALIGRFLAEERTNTVDTVIKRVLEISGFTDLRGVSIVALGGYGRCELSPYSDVDILFLYRNRSKTLAKEVAELILYFLWDLKLDVGHSVRTIEECVELSQDDEDTTILTSLLDSRFIVGDELFYSALENEIYNELLPRNSANFIKKKLEEKEQRISRFGKTVYLLEPNVKESEGGLRDLHTSIWIAQAKFKVKNLNEILQKGFLTEKEFRVVEKCVNFLLLVRSELHYLAERREDNLSFGSQERIARFFGYKDAGLKAVERFMRVYYLRASLVKQQSQIIIDKCTQKPRSRSSKKTVHLEHGFIIQGGFLSVTSRNVFKEDPCNLLRAFEYINKFNIEMSRYLIWLMRENVALIDDSVRRNIRFNKIFFSLLKNGNDVSKILLQMNELRILARYIPEFGRIVCMVQHDAYHVYTVDIHSIFMVKEIEKLLNYEYHEEFRLLTKISESLVKRHVLYLACLFHDMGKGSGKNHSQKGAAMIPKIADRMGLNPIEAEQLEFLVRHHLVMPHFSQRRDIHDPTLIQRFARSVKSLETLSLLYLLTFADIRSVGPEVWTNWKAMLLTELYLRTSRMIEIGHYKKEIKTDRTSRTINEVVKIAPEKLKEDKIRKILNKMPASYFEGFSAKSILKHITLINASGKGLGTDIINYQLEGYDEFTLWGFNQEGIFSKLCGIMSINGLNILGARIVTTIDDRILDVFYVNKLEKSTSDASPLWEKIKNDIENVTKGALDVEKVLDKRNSGNINYRKKVPEYPSKIVFDNQSSDSFTVIDVYTHDRPALLFDITNSLRHLGLTIDYAKISTKVDQVVDAFYVCDKKGKKIEDEKRLEEIKNSLLKAINNQ